MRDIISPITLVATSKGLGLIKKATNENIATVLPNVCVIKPTKTPLETFKEFVHHHGKESLRKTEYQMICLLSRFSKIDSFLNHLFH